MWQYYVDVDDYDNTSKTRRRFGETTFGNCVIFTVDGQVTLRLMYEAMAMYLNYYNI